MQKFTAENIFKIESGVRPKSWYSVALWAFACSFLFAPILCATTNVTYTELIAPPPATLPSVPIGSTTYSTSGVVFVSGDNIILKRSYSVYDPSYGINYTLGHYFHLYRSGTYAPISPPNARPSSLSVAGISGDNVVGNYQDSNSVYHAFLYNSGTYTDLIPPFPATIPKVPVGSSASSTFETVFVSGDNVILKRTYSVDTPGVSSYVLANYFYLYQNENYTEIAVSGAKPVSFSVAGISGNSVAGNYQDTSNIGHCFLYRNGTATELTPPLPATLPSVPAGYSISNPVLGVVSISGGNVVLKRSYYSRAPGNSPYVALIDYFYLYHGGTYTSISPSNATATSLSVVDISGNNVVGNYEDSSSNSHAFLYNGGTYTNLTPPSADTLPYVPDNATVYSRVGAVFASGDNVILKRDYFYSIPGGYSNYSLASYFYLYNRGTYTPISLSNANSLSIVGISGNNVVGNYRDEATHEHSFLGTAPSEISLVLYRASSVTNGGWDQTVDQPLIPNPDVNLCPDPGTGNPPLPEIKGLVADGVTPLVLKFKANDNSDAPSDYTLSVSLFGGALTENGSSLTAEQIASQIQVLSNDSWAPAQAISPTEIRIPISSTHPAFAFIPGIKPESLVFSPGFNHLTVELSIQSNATGKVIALPTFQIRKPPIVLVHGYNVKDSDLARPFSTLYGDLPTNGWAPESLHVFQDAVGSDFVLPITYGNKEENTYYPLRSLAQQLNTELSMVENPETGPFKNWAFTRYDLVCHSQGGVLARMLCMTTATPAISARAPFSPVPFRSEDNSFRGRFRRIVTIGSPHNGSRIVHYLFNLKKSNSRYYSCLPFFLKQLGVLQDKFDPFSCQISDINNPGFKVDSNAKFNMVATHIFDGKAPYISSFSAIPGPAAYLTMGLFAIVPGSNYSRGQIVIGGTGGFPSPDNYHGGGSDGAVDLTSQRGGPGSVSQVFASKNIAHADIPFLFGVPPLNSDTSNPELAFYVGDLLARRDDEHRFGPFIMHEQFDPSVDSAKAELDGVTPSLKASGEINETTNGLSGQSESAGWTIHTYSLSIDSQDPLQDQVTWYAEVYGPGGVASDGVTVTVDPDDSTKASVSVDSSVLGDVVLKATYISTTGAIIFPSPVIVESIPLTMAQTGISLSPSPVTVTNGGELDLLLNKVYEDGTIQPVFLTDAAPAQFSSSNSAVLTVDAIGTVKTVAPGQATVTATYGGFSAQATVTVVAAGAGPAITSADAANGTAYQNFSYAITATNAPSSFAASGLPAGLGIDPNTGIISGVPSSSGIFTAIITVGNATPYPAIGVLTITIAPPAPFDQWRAGHFNSAQLADPNFSGSAATPQKDGVPNLLKYVYNIDPSRGMTATDRAALPVMDIITSGGIRYLTLTYRQNSSMTGVTVSVQKSTDLKTWSTVTPPDFTLQIGLDSNTHDPIMQLGVLVKDDTKQFIRLNATSP